MICGQQATQAQQILLTIQSLSIYRLIARESFEKENHDLESWRDLNTSSPRDSDCAMVEQLDSLLDLRCLGKAVA